MITTILILVIPWMGANFQQLQINPQQIISSIENALAQEYRVEVLRSTRVL